MPRRGSPPPPLLNLPFLIIIAVPILAFLLLFVAVPFTTHKIRPPIIAVKSSWDSLNIFLVLFAILCGIFARRNDDDSTSNDTQDNSPQNNISLSDHDKPARPAVSKQWFDDDHDRLSNRAMYDSTPATGMTRMKRSSSSYPDLRQEDSLWETADDRFRFFDDFEIHKYRSSAAAAAASASAEYIHHRRQPIFDDSEIKEIPVDTSVPRPSPPPQSTAPPPPPPPPPPPTTTTRQKRSKTYNSVPRREKPSNKVHTPPPPPPPPPRPPPSPLATKIIRSAGKSERKRNNATKEIKMVFASLYNQRKRKKNQKTKIVSYEKDDSSPHSSPEQPSFTRPSPSPPPPPPPPPPLPSVFHNLFRKGSKIKRIHSFSAPPPPPPPPQYKRRSHVPHPPPAPPTLPPRRRNQTSGRPPLPTRVSNNFYDHENVNSGGQSPLIPMPPPPPPPPFRVPGFRFVMKGDFVTIRSGHSSRCGSPDREEVEKESTEGVSTMDGKDRSLGSHFCPSPDVNLKADSFIARLRDEWRLEKVNSWREKGIAGHGPAPETGGGN